VCTGAGQRGSEKVPKVPEKVWEVLFGAEPGQVQQGRRRFQEALVQSQVRFNRVSGEGCGEGPGEGFGNLWCRARARSGSTGSTGLPALGFAARFRKICKNKTLRLLGIPPELI